MSIRLRLLLIMILLIFLPLAAVFGLGLREFMADKLRDVDSFAQDGAANFAVKVSTEFSKVVDLQRLIVERAVADPKEQFSFFVKTRFAIHRSLVAAVVRIEPSSEAVTHVRNDVESLAGVSTVRVSEFLRRIQARPAKPGVLDVVAFADGMAGTHAWFQSVVPVRVRIETRSAAGAGGTAQTELRSAQVGVLMAMDFGGHDVRTGALRYVIDREGIALVRAGSVASGTRVSNPLVEAFRSSAAQPGASTDGAGAAITKSYRADGRDVIGALSPLSGTEAAVMVEFSRSLATDALEGLTKKAVFIVAAVFIIAAIVALFFARSIVRPIESLTAASHAVAGGDFHVAINVRARDEVGALATAFKQMQEGLLQRDNKLEQARMELIQSEKLSALGRMSAGITHELKNPLAGIIGFAQLGQRVLAEDHQVARYLKLIEKEGKRTKEIIDSLLKFARKEEVKFERIVLNKVAEDAMTLVAHQLSTMGVVTAKQFDPSLPEIRGSFNQLEQVLINLLVNAAQAMERSGGGKITVSTHAAPPGFAEILVADTGCGIPRENLSRIFDPFFTSKEPGKGTGLGLSVTLGIVKAHNGTIDVESTVNVGTTFRIRLPFWEAGEGAVVPSGPTSGAASGSGAPGATRPPLTS